MSLKVGEKKIVKYSIFFALWLIAVLWLPWGSYLQKVTLAVPSYLAVLFGSYAFLKIGFKLATIPEFEGEQDKLKKDIERAREFYQKKGLKLTK